MASVSNQASPAVSALAVTPADGTTLTNGPCRSLYIGGAGDISVIPVNQTTAVIFSAVLGGTILPVMVTSVQATATTATGIVALY